MDRSGLCFNAKSDGIEVVDLAICSGAADAGIAVGDAIAAMVTYKDSKHGVHVSNRGATGRVRVQLFGKSFSATWRVVAGSVEVRSVLGLGKVGLGALASAPSIVAAEKLREMALEANQIEKPKPDRARFNIRDA